MTHSVAMVDMAKRRMARAIESILELLLLAGCTVPVVVPPVELELEVVDEDQGWVQVQVIGVTSLGYTLRWGDVTTSYGTSDVLPPKELYEHFYQVVESGSSGGQVPTSYEITLIDEEGVPVARESVRIATVDCHLSLVVLAGRKVTVQYWGRFGIQYSVSWGDQYATHLIADGETGTGLLTHTYAEAGTYSLGMQEIWAPPHTSFTVVVQ